MRVHINGELVVECSHLLPERWNGWAVPVFTLRQADEVVDRLVALGWATEDDAPFLPTHIGNDEYVTYGFTWEVVGESEWMPLDFEVVGE